MAVLFGTGVAYVHLPNETGRMKCAVILQGAGRRGAEEGGDSDEEVDVCASVGGSVCMCGGVFPSQPRLRPIPVMRGN